MNITFVNEKDLLGKVSPQEIELAKKRAMEMISKDPNKAKSYAKSNLARMKGMKSKIPKGVNPADFYADPEGDIEELLLANEIMKGQSGKSMNKIASMRAAAELVKTASAVMVRQQQELEALRNEIAQRDQAEKAAELAVRMADAGHIDHADLEEKAAEFASRPDQMPVINEAINLLDNGNFKIASLSDEQSAGYSARSQLEAFLLGDI